MSNITTETYSQAGEILRNIIRENGTEILGRDELSDKLKEHGCDSIVAYQILLILKSSNFTRYISQQATGISMIDVNNIITCAVNETGLSRLTVKQLVTAILYGLSMPTDIESVTLPAENGYKQQDIAFVDFAQYEKDLIVLERAVSEKDEETVGAYAEKLELLANAGHPKALYYKGACLYYGISVPADNARAIKYLRAAAESGCIRANALLGDAYYNSKYPMDTKAFRHYTAVGAVALDEPRQNKVKAILKQKDTGLVTLCFSAVLLVAIIVFNAMIGSGVFSFNGETHWALAIVSMILNIGAFGGGVYYWIRFRYDSVKWLIPVMTVIAMLFAMMAI